MRKLLLFFAMLCVSIGTWADGSEAGYYLSGSTWCGDKSTKETVAKIHLTKSGVLAAAIDEINADDGFVYNYNSNPVNLKTAKKIYINSDEGVYLSPADIQALATLGYETIDLQDLNYESAFTFSNSSVKNLILPDGWTKAQVTACATGVGNQLGSAFSIGNYTTGKSITAYVNKGNTLYDAVNRCFMDDKPNTKLNTNEGVNQNNMKKPELKCLSISGNPVARDFSSYNENVLFDANGHFVFDQEASENSDTPNTGVNGTRKLTGETYGGGAMDGVSLIELDLQDAVITEAHCSDLTLSWTFVLGEGTRIVRFPTCSELKTIPADCLAGVNGISEICIPSNIENIKTRAFAASIDHIWTTAATGDVENTCYDNGLYNADYEQIVDSEGKPLIGYTNQDFGESVAGTYTFSSNLKLIERFAFSNTQPYVSDVFVLAEEAPECHVDAFGCSFYVSYSGYGVTPGAEGIVERSSFKNGNYWMTMLHYPRNCATPQIQRYTDPTREYSIATGLVDGKGANIYFPQANEFAVAYLQGTYGYTWKAWDTATRNSWGDVTLHPGIATNAAWSAGGQATANTLYTGQTPSATFYDTTLGGNTKPDGLQKYTEVEWEGQKLYPAPETSDVQYSDEEVQATDAYGYPAYVEDSENGTYVKDYTYVQEDRGEFERIASVADEVSAFTKSKKGVSTYYSDAAGSTEATPVVTCPEGTTYYVQDGVNNTYSDAVYSPVNGVTTYYRKDNNGNYFESYMYFGTASQPNTYYYNPVTSEVPNYKSTTNIVAGVTSYYSDANGTIPVTPSFDVTYYYPTGQKIAKGWVYEWYSDKNASMDHYTKNGDEYVKVEGATYNNQYWVYYNDLIDEYKETDKLVSNVTTYYLYGWHTVNNQNVQGYYEATPAFSTAVYYQQGNKTVTTYSSTTYYLPDVDTYYQETHSGSGVYTVKNINDSGTFNEAYYYATGSTPKIVEACGTAYKADATYYTDAAATTPVTSVEFDKTYYAKDITYTYVAATTATAAENRYNKVYSDHTYRLFDEDIDASNEQLYSPKMEKVIISQTITKQYDYRGWHQFVLTGYAANSTEIITQHRSYLTDCDWWTICLPYDLTYNEMVLFYGDKASNKIPYLSILQNVVRDMKNESITLNFSENLMLHKATKNDVGDWEVSTTKAVPSDPANEVILHAGVPYLIRPNFVGSNRQFDIYGSATANANLSEGRITANSTDYPGLYEKLKAAETMDGNVQLQLVADGLITVPALVANLDDPDATMTENIGNKVFTYKGKTYPVSSDWDYTFVGSFYKSMIPAYSYYLGYDTKAKFFFANVPFNPNVPMYTGMKWNNNTAIICPNMLNSSVSRTWNLGKGNSDGKVTKAYGSGATLIPAQWFLNDVTVQDKTYKGLTIDDLSAKPSNSKGFGMGFGGFMELIDNGDATGINNVKTFISVDDKVYSLDGRHVGNSLNGLQKGTYVKNGKKYIVK